MTVPAGITPREQAMYLQGVIKANEERAEQFAATINTLTQGMYECHQTVLSAKAELRSLQAAHYADLEAEAAKDQAQGRAEDFRMGGAA